MACKLCRPCAIFYIYSRKNDSCRVLARFCHGNFLFRPHHILGKQHYDRICAYAFHTGVWRDSVDGHGRRPFHLYVRLCDDKGGTEVWMGHGAFHRSFSLGLAGAYTGPSADNIFSVGQVSRFVLHCSPLYTDSGYHGRRWNRVHHCSRQRRSG